MVSWRWRNPFSIAGFVLREGDDDLRASVCPAPEAWRHALLLAGGDHSQLTVNADGTVSVANKPVRIGSAVG